MSQSLRHAICPRWSNSTSLHRIARPAHVTTRLATRCRNRRGSSGTSEIQRVQTPSVSLLHRPKRSPGSPSPLASPDRFSNIGQALEHGCLDLQLGDVPRPLHLGRVALGHVAVLGLAVVPRDQRVGLVGEQHGPQRADLLLWARVTHILRPIQLILGVNSRPGVTHIFWLIQFLLGVSSLPGVTHGPIRHGILIGHDLSSSLAPTARSKSLEETASTYPIHASRNHRPAAPATRPGQAKEGNRDGVLKALRRWPYSWVSTRCGSPL